MDIDCAATLIRAWAGRRAAKGIPVTDDETWARINLKWPNLERSMRELIWPRANSDTGGEFSC
jgi:hypothetical protein